MKSRESCEIYVHVPFCARKCDYCDFISFVTDADTQDRYFNMLVCEIEKKAESVGRIPVDSVFLGGGTPSLVKAANIGKVMDKLYDVFDISPNAEITIEMNPNSASLEKMQEYRSFGINRLSIGLQSADNNELKTLSRLHTFEDFVECFENARKAGFSNINVDLMSAVPGQTMESLKETLSKVIALKPEHISAYSLILEEGTKFFERYPDGEGLPGEDADREMYALTKKILAENGYERYEISNYARTGYECRHNIGYWTRKEYLGFGIAAASLFDNVRSVKHSDLKRYIAGDFAEETTHLSSKDIMEEYMFLGLRLIKGVSKADFEAKFGKSMESVYGEVISRFEKQGLIASEDRVYLTDAGLDVSNCIMAEFLLD